MPDRIDGDRFEVTYKQGKFEGCWIIVDRQTGVNYLFSFVGTAAGLTVLLDADGRPVVSKPERAS